MTLNQKSIINLISAELAEAEGGKSEAKMGDVKQIVSILSDMMVDDSEVVAALLVNGLKRKAKRLAKRRK